MEYLRPLLEQKLKVEEFRSFYWLKEELQIFCRENGMSASGSKMEIADRVAAFLETGERQLPRKIRKSHTKETKTVMLDLDTIITENHRCSQAVRAFFKSQIPSFHFSTFIQNYFKENVGKTYRDAVSAWYAEEERKKNSSNKKEIAPQFEYNQFIRDYFSDSKNKGKKREDAIAAWQTIKKLPGNNKYISTSVSEKNE